METSQHLLTVIISFFVVFPLHLHAKQDVVFRYGLLETRPTDGAQGRRYCVTYFPKVHNLTMDSTNTTSHPVSDLTEWDGCGPPPAPAPATAGRWVFLNQSKAANCSIDQRVANLLTLQAAGIVIQVNESYDDLAASTNSSPMPVTFISWRHVPAIVNASPPVEAIQYGIPEETLFNYGLIIIWVIANTTILLGAIWSATVKYELHTQEEQARRDGPAGGRSASVTTTQPAAGELSSTPVTVISAVAAIALIITFLLLSYFFPKVMYYVVLVLFFIGSVSGVYTCLSAVNARMPCSCDLGLAPAVTTRCCSCRVRVSQLLLFAVSLAAGIVWLVFRDNDVWGWALQDVLGVAFTLSLIRSCRLPNLRIMTFFAVGLLIYDIFFVFITPLFTANGKSIMVEVATGGGDYILPMVLKVPYIVHSQYPECQSPQSFSLLGYGDIIVPGFIVAYCASIDKIHGIAYHAYLVTAATGYGVGLIVTFVALYAMEAAQPALLYLVPLTLLPVVVVALIRRQLKLLWHGAKQPSGGELIREHADYNSVSPVEE
ncbi:signal peptide peptidase-like 2A [Amphibalanus amphitrite]|uniref:signal peptide peptidase-like 2A n=1 Tax=Amphibalanus amphitrite TaxID=1232801 RepID=UPI001C9039C6|nr:signal peptide peptidase-like 2A [Amphibalanus amphitrite]